MNQHELTVRYWRIVFVIWFILLTIATHLPQAPPTDYPIFISPDKLLHFVCFGVLAFMFMCGGWFKNPLSSMSLLLGWSILDELSQDLMPNNRDFSTSDVIASVLGIVSAYIWCGSLRTVHNAALEGAVDSVLAKGKNWFTLAWTGVFSITFIGLSCWFLLRFAFGEQQSNAAFFIAVSITISVLLLLIIRKSKIKLYSFLDKNTVLYILGSMVVTFMIGLGVCQLGYSPWIWAAFAFVLSLRYTWGQVT
tara:strand:- start:386 stop:1135 length:750 start_codon:yes stop_codon:yes gene_type:complete